MCTTVGQSKSRLRSSSGPVDRDPKLISTIYTVISVNRNSNRYEYNERGIEPICEGFKIKNFIEFVYGIQNFRDSRC